MIIELWLPADEVVHAAPTPGLSFCPCCDAGPADLTAYSRISTDPASVTCGRFSLEDEALLYC